MLSLKKAAISGMVVFLSCLLYFSAGVRLIPDSAGPDMDAHLDITRFISEQGRLPVLPKEADMLHISSGGTTRATRPPFAYIVGAITAKLAPSSIHLSNAYALGSALLMALCVLVTFITVVMLYRRISYGLLAATIMALMPQFSFIASYINDDSSAIFAGSLLTASIALLVIYKLNHAIVAFVAFSCGITILSKLSAWLLLPFVGLAALLHLRNIGQHFIVYALLFSAVFVASGAWWPISNMLRYGFDDPIMFGVANALIEQFDNNPNNNNIGFAAQGQTYFSLLIGNYMGFVDNTYQSTVGYLDQLRLRLTPIQYRFYLPIFAMGIIAYLVRFFPRLFFSSSSGVAQDSNRNALLLETLLVLAMLFQVLMYTRFNLQQDIQVQGKYLLPAFPAIMLLFISALDALLKLIKQVWEALSVKAFNFNAAVTVSCLTLCVAVIGVHAHALALHVLPFYRPPAIQLSIGTFQPIDLSNDNVIRDLRGAELKVEDQHWVFNSKKGGTYITLHPTICTLFGPSTLIRISLDADHADYLKFFFNEGLGHVEKHTGKTYYKAGENTSIFSLKHNHCQNLRIDIMLKPGTVVVKEIAFAQFTQVPKYR